MAIAKRTRSAQYPLVADFVFNYNDGFPVLATLNAASQDSNPRPTITDFGSKTQPTGMLSGSTYVANTNAAACYFEVITLPLGAQVTSGDVIIEAPYVGPGTVTLALGNAFSSAEYFTAATLKATDFTNQPSGITNAGADPRVVTITSSGVSGVSAVGQTVTVSGCTGASAAYNGVFTVASYTSTTVVVTNPNLTTSLTLAGTAACQFAPVRAALLIPSIASAGSPSGAQDASGGFDMRGTLTFSGGQAATQGRVRVRVHYIIEGRGNEVITT